MERLSCSSKESAKLARKLVQTAREYLGAPTHVYTNPEEGTDPTQGFDCSGFVTFLLREIGTPPPPRVRHARDYYKKWGEFVPAEERRAGDLVFFSADGKRVTHVGVLSSPNTLIHSSGMRYQRVVEQPLPYWPIPDRRDNRRFHTNPIGFKRFS